MIDLLNIKYIPILSLACVLAICSVNVKAEDLPIGSEVTVGNGPTTYFIGMGPGSFRSGGFPPWETNVLEGPHFEITKAVCEANKAMKCVIQDREYNECQFTDSETGEAVVGPSLALGLVDGCIDWGQNTARLDAGLTFANPYFLGPPAGLLVRADFVDDEDGDDDPRPNLMNVGFKQSFGTDAICLAELRDLVDPDNNIESFNDLTDMAGQGSFVYADRNAAVAGLAAGEVDSIFWDNVDNIPADLNGVAFSGIQLDISPCIPGAGLMGFEDSLKRKNRSARLYEEWNCGLSLIAHADPNDNAIIEICESTKSPENANLRTNCIPDDRVPEPTAKCLARQKGNR